MGNYKKKAKEEERSLPLTILSVGFIGPTAGFIGMFFNQWGQWLLIGTLIGLAVGIWLDWGMIKSYFAEKKARKLAVEKEEARREKIRQERKNK